MHTPAHMHTYTHIHTNTHRHTPHIQTHTHTHMHIPIACICTNPTHIPHVCSPSQSSTDLALSIKVLSCRVMLGPPILVHMGGTMKIKLSWTLSYSGRKVLWGQSQEVDLSHEKELGWCTHVSTQDWRAGHRHPSGLRGPRLQIWRLLRTNRTYIHIYLFVCLFVFYWKELAHVIMEAGVSKLCRTDVPVQIQRLEDPGRTDG